MASTIANSEITVATVLFETPIEGRTHEQIFQQVQRRIPELFRTDLDVALRILESRGAIVCTETASHKRIESGCVWKRSAAC
jgi:hypothetical protein